MPSVTLSLEELLLIDGKVNAEAQAVIDSVKEAHRIQAESGLSDTEAFMVQKIVASSRKELRLAFHITNITNCPCCGRRDGYYAVSRTTRYKQKGNPDYDKPKLVRAYSINPGFVCIKNYISLGFCESCKDRVLPHVLEALKDDHIEISENLSGVPPKFKRYRNRKCKKCDWAGHEGEMKWAPSLMGDGKFPAYCPTCGAGGIFNNDVEITDGHSIVGV